MFLGFAMAAAATAGPALHADDDGVEGDRLRSVLAAPPDVRRTAGKSDRFYDSMTAPAEPSQARRLRQDGQVFRLE